MVAHTGERELLARLLRQYKVVIMAFPPVRQYKLAR